MQATSLIIFDLGSVIFDANFARVFSSWADLLGCRVEDVQHRFRFDSSFEKFECGALSPEEYHAHIRDNLSIELSFSQFVTGWNSIYGEEFEGADECLRLLGTKYRLVAFTNTNEVHSRIWPSRFSSVLKNFERIFSSVEIGCRKPHPEGFRYVLEQCGVRAEEAVFLDDLAVNVQAAAALGIRSILVDPPGIIRPPLEAAGLLELE